jgi:hypothetical protein
MRSFETCHLPVSSKDLNAALKWFGSKRTTQQDALVKKHKIITYADLIKAFKEGN